MLPRVFLFESTDSRAGVGQSSRQVKLSIIRKFASRLRYLNTHCIRALGFSIVGGCPYTFSCLIRVLDITALKLHRKLQSLSGILGFHGLVYKDGPLTRWSASISLQGATSQKTILFSYVGRLPSYLRQLRQLVLRYLVCVTEENN
jgi:hypothetical protein